MKNARPLLTAVVLVQSLGAVHADGGSVRFSRQCGNYHITVFTSPIPFRSGPVDVSVFVQDAGTGRPVSDTQITVRASSHEHPETSIIQQATAAAATNKLFQAAVFDLPEAGWWDVNIFIKGANEPIDVQFQVEAIEALPRAWALAPWISWPAIVVALFCIHKWMVERKQRGSKRAKKAGTHNGEPALVTLSPNQRNSV